MNPEMHATSTRKLSRFTGFNDLEGRFIPFSHADEVMLRARSSGVRVLLRLQLNHRNELEGILYSNEESVRNITPIDWL